MAASGLRIRSRCRRADPALAERFRALPVALVSDAMGRLVGVGAPFRPFYAGPPMAGPALTVRTAPGDNLLVHKAIDLAEPGDVVVVDAGGALAQAIIGEMMALHARMRGLGGLVIHGAVRDSLALKAGTFPVFACGVSHRGPFKNGPGEINALVALAGMVVSPGDLVLGDADGLLAIAPEEAEAVLDAALERQDLEERQMAAIREGRDERGWIDARLTELGCRIDPA